MDPSVTEYQKIKYYTTEQVAEMFEISTYTAREWMRTGKINGKKFHGYWRVSEEDLRAFVAEMTGANDAAH